ncbi:MAG: peroxiredoxin [Pirellulales bacterium]
MAKLQVGDRAPEFVASNQRGETVRLSDYLGKRGLVLFFYPKDGTAVCTKEACAFRDSYDQFAEAGFEVMGISSDSVQSHGEFSAQHALEFPLLSDPDGAVRAAFGVPKSLGFVPGRVTYVIDRSGVIRLIFSALLASHEHVAKALEAVKSTNE